VNQTALFDREEFPPASRADDPSTSKAAEQRVTRSGARKTQADIVLQAVVAYPGRTAVELTTVCQLDRYQVSRRLADLEHQGRVRKGKRRVCAVQKTDAHEWFPSK
jgi:hypothetical protein